LDLDLQVSYLKLQAFDHFHLKYGAKRCSINSAIGERGIKTRSST
jgi:hypothetical protein